ncbi:MAG: DUF4198 domain-containing protein [Actinomycetota bacterium]|nr:DUF4198 domain-containing protein [Actinomycetota bacterium]
MHFRRTSLLALVAALSVGLVAAPPASSAPSQQDAVAKSTFAAAKKAAKKGMLSGTVTFQGKPAAATWIEVRGGGKKYVERTNKKGRFSVKVAPGKYHVTAGTWNLPTWVTWYGNTRRKPDAKTVKVAGGKAARIAIKLKTAAQVEGRAFESDGSPSWEGDVSWENSSEPGKIRTIETSEDGYYSLRTASAATLTIRFGGDSLTVRAKKGKIVTAPDLHATPVAEGKIIARVEGALENYTNVHAVSQDGQNRVRLYPEGPEGPWFASVPVGTWFVELNTRTTKTAPVEVTEGATVDAGTLVIPAGRGEIHLEAFDKNGKLSKDGEVIVFDQNWGHVKEKRRVNKKRVKITSLIPGTYWVTLNFWHGSTHEGVSPRPKKVVVEAEDTEKVTLRLEKGRTVKGVVRFKGKPVRGLQVDIEDPSGVWYPNGYATTDARGRFVIKNVPKKAGHLRVYDPWGVYREKTRAFATSGKVSGLKIKITK